MRINRREEQSVMLPTITMRVGIIDSVTSNDFAYGAAFGIGRLRLRNRDWDVLNGDAAVIVIRGFGVVDGC